VLNFDALAKKEFMELSDISTALDNAWNRSVKDGVSPHVLEVLPPSSRGEPILVRGNREGLLYLARICVDLAEAKVDGSHFHLDRHSMLSSEDAPLIVAYRRGPLDDEQKA
jgi:hypothetical protein